MVLGRITPIATICIPLDCRSCFSSALLAADIRMPKESFMSPPSGWPGHASIYFTRALSTLSSAFTYGPATWKVHICTPIFQSFVTSAEEESAAAVESFFVVSPLPEELPQPDSPKEAETQSRQPIRNLFMLHCFVCSEK